jgi:hypothetical protein
VKICYNAAFGKGGEGSEEETEVVNLDAEDDGPKEPAASPSAPRGKKYSKVLVDILLSLLVRPSNLLRDLAKQGMCMCSSISSLLLCSRLLSAVEMFVFLSRLASLVV